MSRALDFMNDPRLASSVLPCGAELDLADFLAQSGTLYMIADTERSDSPLAPLFAAMAGEVHWIACQVGSRQPGGRLDPPLLMALDEIVQTCPVPLPTWAADSGGKGIQLVTVAHGEAQLASRWKDEGKQVILDTASVRLLLPGITDTGTLEAAATLCGQAAYREHGQEHHSRHDSMTPDMIRRLPAGYGLAIRGGMRPSWPGCRGRGRTAPTSSSSGAAKVPRRWSRPPRPFPWRLQLSPWRCPSLSRSCGWSRPRAWTTAASWPKSSPSAPSPPPPTRGAARHDG